MDIAKQRHNPCSAKPGCGLTEGQHEKRIIHDDVRIVVRVADSDDAGEKSEDMEKQPVVVKEVEEDQIFVWESCGICAAKTSQKLMSTGSLFVLCLIDFSFTDNLDRLFSYAKYLELLIYSPLVCSLTPSLCEHTTPPSSPWPALPSSRFNIVRHFTTASADISFSLSPVEEVFELRAPRLQIIRGVDKAPSPFTKVEVPLNADGDQSIERKELRRQIRTWWEGVSDHLDKIVGFLVSPIPSSYETYRSKH
jgi:1-phosphatidylinositol-3-phosphate 5-kinase